jgi:hypothetical protein
VGDYALQSDYTSQPNVEYKDDTPNFKGWWYEIMDCKPQLNAIPNISYEGNPSNYEDWKSDNQKSKYDGVVTLPNGEIITLEFKRRDCPKVYHSWFMQCWLPREADWIITNNTQCISYKDRRLLEAEDKKLFSLSEAIVEIGRLVENILHPRKYLYFNSLLLNFINYIFEFSSKISSKIIKLGFKIRFKNCLLGLKSSFGARLSKSYLAGFINARKSYLRQDLKFSQVSCNQGLKRIKSLRMTNIKKPIKIVMKTKVPILFL